MSKYGNSKSDKKKEDIRKIVSLLDETDIITNRCKFNFHYFDDHNVAGQKFSDWTQKQLVSLLESLKSYSCCDLNYWITQTPTFVIYGKFPPKAKTDFNIPQSIPTEARWGRFRLGNKIRLVGFMIPGNFHGKEHGVTKERWDSNTFYVVFLDKEHQFWKTEKP